MRKRKRVWFVNRSFDDGRIITVTYATGDGEESLTRQHNLSTLSDGVPVSIEVASDELSTVSDPERQAQYRNEVARIRAEHDLDDRV